LDGVCARQGLGNGAETSDRSGEARPVRLELASIPIEGELKCAGDVRFEQLRELPLQGSSIACPEQEAEHILGCEGGPALHPKGGAVLCDTSCQPLGKPTRVIARNVTAAGCADEDGRLRRGRRPHAVVIAGGSERCT
jgi:hypothetical protein